MVVLGDLVGGLNPKNMSSSIGMIIPNILEIKKCSKPPTRDYLWINLGLSWD